MTEKLLIILTNTNIRWIDYVSKSYMYVHVYLSEHLRVGALWEESAKFFDSVVYVESSSSLNYSK